MKVIYLGPFDAVVVPAASVVAERDKPVEVPDDIAESLLAQGWAPAKAASKTKDGE